MAQDRPWETSDLVFGWKVTKRFEPQYWEDSAAKPGGHLIENVVTTDPKTIAYHTVIVAQSGSGKSFFLGRVLEEILLKTRGRVLILDSNSDFRKFAEAKSDKYWVEPEKYRYNRKTCKGFLADEPTQADFLGLWKKISKVVYSRRLEPGDFELLLVDWLKLPIDLLLEDAADEWRDQLRHCHNLVGLLAELAVATNNEEWLKEGQLLPLAKTFCDDTKPNDTIGTIDFLRKTFGSVKATKTTEKSPEENVIIDRNGQLFVRLPSHFPTLSGVFLGKDEVPVKDLEAAYAKAATHRVFVEEKAKSFYFAKAFEIERSELIAPRIRESFEPNRKRVQIVDLPSIPDPRHQKMVISTFIESEWQNARAEWVKAFNKPQENDERVPTFIVVEEAHNAVPSDAETTAEKKLQEQFRRIAAEGRKYGVFLILVSQRPDKLDRMVMSECENRAVMKVGSSLILRTTCDVLGLESTVPRMDRVLDFDLGRALLIGPWAGGEPKFLVSAARRTEEGGRDLRWEYWAMREPDIAAALKATEDTTARA